jgi:transcriptional regulator with XRE-family HTH domain
MSTKEPALFGGMLRRYRTASQLTQKQLSVRSGVSQGAIAALERGARRALRTATVERLANALGLSGAERADFRTPC